MQTLAKNAGYLYCSISEESFSIDIKTGQAVLIKLEKASLVKNLPTTPTVRLEMMPRSRS
jgi:hypothetical protein